MDNPGLTTALQILPGLAAAAGLACLLFIQRRCLPGLLGFPEPLASAPGPCAAFAAPKAAAKRARKAARPAAPAPESAPPPTGAAPAEAPPPVDIERRRLGTALVFVGFWFGFLSLMLRADLPADNPNAYLPFLGIGLLLFMGGMHIASRLDRRTVLDPPLEWAAARLGTRPSQVVCLGGGVLLAGLATVAAGTASLMISPLTAILAWLSGIALVILGGWDFAPRAGKATLSKDALLWAAGLTVAAFLLRAVLVGQIPVMLSGDEGSTGMDALQFRTGGVDNPFGIFGWHPFPSLYSFIESLGIAVFGRTAAALRYPSALAGALTVGGLYLLVRAMYSHRHALASALFLSALHLHMHFSRLGVMNTWDGLWYLITLGGLWYGWTSGKRAYWISAGLAMGIGQYFYATSRTLFVAAPLLLGAAAVFDRAKLRLNLRNLIPMLAALTAVLLPLAWWIGTHFDHYMADVRTNSILGEWMEIATRESGLPVWRILLDQLELGFGGFFSVNLSFWYRPDQPILRTLPAVFFIFGLAILCLRLRDTRTWVPLLWLAAYGMVVSLSESAPAAQRLPGVGAACALVVGFGAVEFVSILANLFPARQRLLGVAAVLLVGILAVDDLRFYFFDFTPNSTFLGKYDFVGAGGEVARKIVEQLEDEEGEWEVVFFNNGLMGFYSNPALRYLLPNAEGMDLENDWGSPENPEVPEGNLYFVFMPGRESNIPLVQADFPGGSLGEVYAPDGSLLFTYYVRRSPL
ncbi:MAG: glycosyltransferase family 39 protein [Anaerolineales bacterium]|nr:glycosyltransferase family 39 protein [Anaerolineales bacterium]